MTHQTDIHQLNIVCTFEKHSICTHDTTKKLRKTAALTEAQSRKLHQLSELDGLDPVEHTMRAIDQYLSKQNFNLDIA